MDDYVALHDGLTDESPIVATLAGTINSSRLERGDGVPISDDEREELREATFRPYHQVM